MRDYNKEILVKNMAHVGFGFGLGRVWPTRTTVEGGVNPADETLSPPENTLNRMIKKTGMI